MKKYFIPMHHTHSCVAGLYFHGGNIVENRENRGISHLLEHMIFRRLDTLKMKQLYRNLNRQGFNLRGFTNEKMIGFYIQTPPEKINDASDLLLKILHKYDYTEEEVEAEKRVVLRQIDEKSVYFFDKKTHRKYYRNTPFAKMIMGRQKDVEKIDATMVNEYKNKLFCSENAVFIMTGNFTNEVQEEISHKIEQIEAVDNRQGIYTSEMEDVLPKHFGKRTEKDDLLVDCGYSLCDMSVSFDILRECNPFAVDMLMNIFVNGDGAKLQWKLKDKKGWTGDVFGSIENFANFARFKIDYAVEEEDLPDSMICFAKTLQKAKENLSEKDREEVIGFHTFQPGLWDDSCEYNQYIAESVFTQGSSAYEVKEIIRQYANVTVEELKQLANEIFTPENMSISVGYDSWYTKKSTLEKKCRKMRKILGGQYL